MPTIDLNRVTLRYELSGNPAGDVLVFSTSLGLHLEMWDAQAIALGDTYRILRYDMRGHGRSSVPSGHYAIDQLGADLLALLDVLDISKAHYCGLSIGGVIGQWLAVHHPQRVNKLIIANTAAKIGTADIWNDRIAAVQRDGLAALAEGSLGRWFTPAFRTTGAPIISRLQQMLLADDPAGYTATCAALRDADLREQIASISKPTLVLAGQHDPVTTVPDAEFMHSRISGSKLHILPAAHISNAELPELFNTTVAEFLSASI